MADSPPSNRTSDQVPLAHFGSYPPAFFCQTQLALPAVQHFPHLLLPLHHHPMFFFSMMHSILYCSHHVLHSSNNNDERNLFRFRPFPCLPPTVYTEIFHRGCISLSLAFQEYPAAFRHRSLPFPAAHRQQPTVATSQHASRNFRTHIRMAFRNPCSTV